MLFGMNKTVVFRLNVFFVSLLLIVLSSCSDLPPVTGGNEVPNMFTATIVDNSGSAVANASVRISTYRLSSSGAHATNTIVAASDSLGNVNIKTLEPGNYVLKVSRGNEGYINSFFTISPNVTNNAGRIEIRENRPIRGRMLVRESMDRNAVNIFIPGLAVLSKVDSLGFYTVENVPHGRLDIVFGYGRVINYVPMEIVDNSGDTVHIRDIRYAINASQASGVNISHDVFPSTEGFSVLPVVYPANRLPSWYLRRNFGAVNYFIVESEGVFRNFTDFESAPIPYYEDGLLIHDFDINDPHQNILSILLADIHNVHVDSVGGWWFGYNDIDGGMMRASAIFPDITQYSPIIPFRQALVEEGAYRGRSLRLDFTLGVGDVRPYAGVGFEIAGGDDNFHDFSNLDSLIFYVRGNGTFRVKVISSLWDNRLSDNMGLGRDIVLPWNWTRYAIPVDQLVPYNDSQAMHDGIVWNDISHSIQRIQFEAIGTYRDNLELWLDEIYLKGLSVSDINFP